MKIVLFAHTPPPVHGQSLMVKMMLEGFGGDCRRRSNATAAPATANARSFGLEIYHVNARLSADLPDIGRARPGKLTKLLAYCAQAIWIRFRYGVTAMYYVPAPPRRAAIYRDWIVMLLCRPFFKTVIFHWHGVGLGEWLKQRATPIERWLTQLLLGQSSVSVILSRFNQPDAEVLRPRSIVAVANGIPDPCPDYVHAVAPRRLARAAARRQLLDGHQIPDDQRRQAGEDPGVVQVLFLAHCTRDKGFFDAIQGVRLANARLAERRTMITFRLTLVGAFLREDEGAEFQRLLHEIGEGSWLRHLGFISEPEKWALYRQADMFCFPTYFAFEGQPMNLIEAMAFGLPIVTTRWRSIPEHLPKEYPGLVDIKQPDQVASALIAVTGMDGTVFRGIFENQFSSDKHLEKLASAIKAASST